MEKERLVNFIATIMEDSGFKVKKNYHISNNIIDIYGVLNTSVGNVGVVVACKNYEEPWKIGLDILKDMEVAARAVHASKIVIFTTSSFTHTAAVYAQKRNMKLVDRKGLIKIAKNYAKKRTIVTDPEDTYDEETEYYEPENTKPASLTRGSSSSNNSHAVFSGKLKRKDNSSSNSYQGSLNTTTHTKSSTPLTKKFKNPIHINVNSGGIITFFKNHNIVYMITIIIIASLIAWGVGHITGTGPYTGMGKILCSAIIAYGAMTLMYKDLSEILLRGSVVFFITIIIIVATLTF